MDDLIRVERVPLDFAVGGYGLHHGVHVALCVQASVQRDRAGKPANSASWQSVRIYVRKPGMLKRFAFAPCPPLGHRSKIFPAEVAQPDNPAFGRTRAFPVAARVVVREGLVLHGGAVAQRGRK